MLMRRFAYKRPGIVVLLPLLIVLPLLHLSGHITGSTRVQQAVMSYQVTDQWAMLLKHSDLIVRGRVVSTHSAWNADHTFIETDNMIDVDYALLGQAPQRLIIPTLGGSLANEDLGMASPDTVTFNPQAEVLLFLHKQGQQYQVVGQLAGAYMVRNGIAVDGRGRIQMPMRTLIPALAQAMTQQGFVMHLPDDWQNLEAQSSTRANFSTQNFVYKGYKWTNLDPVIKYKVNMNTVQAGGENGSVEDFRNAIIAAAETWNKVPNIDFKLQYDGETTAKTVGIKSPGLNGVNEVVFMHQGITNTAGVGIYFYRKSDNGIIEADIWLNDDYSWDATGSPTSSELDLQSGALHEFGHWLNLGHDPEETSVMLAYLASGTLKQALGPTDIDGIGFIYPCTAAACKTVDAVTPTATVAPSPTIPSVGSTIPQMTATPQPNIYLPLVTK